MPIDIESDLSVMWAAEEHGATNWFKTRNKYVYLPINLWTWFLTTMGVIKLIQNCFAITINYTDGRLSV